MWHGMSVSEWSVSDTVEWQRSQCTALKLELQQKTEAFRRLGVKNEAVEKVCNTVCTCVYVWVCVCVYTCMYVCGVFVHVHVCVWCVFIHVCIVCAKIFSYEGNSTGDMFCYSHNCRLSDLLHLPHIYCKQVFKKRFSIQGNHMGLGLIPQELAQAKMANDRHCTNEEEVRGRVWWGFV